MRRLRIRTDLRNSTNWQTRRAGLRYYPMRRTRHSLPRRRSPQPGCFQYGCGNGLTSIGVVQTVNSLRFQDLSINYDVPRAVSSMFRIPHLMMSLQGNNLGLHTNYRGKDPNVNAFSTGSEETMDSGQIPEPRTWWLKLSLGN